MVGAQLPLKKLVERLFFTWKTKYQCLRGLTLLLEPLRAVNILACGSEMSAACVCVLSCVQLFGARKALLSMGLCQQEY